MFSRLPCKKNQSCHQIICNSQEKRLYLQVEKDTDRDKPHPVAVRLLTTDIEMKEYIRLIMLIALFCSSAGTTDANVSKEELIGKYQNRLKYTTTNARDSLKVLYYLFDLSERSARNVYAWQIYETAGRANDVNAQMDMLRNLAVLNYENDSIIARLQAMADKISNESARAATKTFIFNQHVNHRTRFPDDPKLSSVLLDSILNSHDLQTNDIYDQIALLFQIVQYIGVEAEGSLVVECLDRYAQLIDELPQSDFPLKNQFYTTSAIFHSRPNGNQKLALKYDRKLLEIMDQLKQMYAKQDRRYRNYDDSKFACYRRMLSNFKVLRPEEVEEIHDSILSLAERNSDVKRALDSDNQVHAYYSFSKGEYRESIPHIKKALESKRLSVYQRLKLYDMLRRAAESAGEHNDYVTAMEHIIKNEYVIDSLRKEVVQREIMLRNTFAGTPVLTNASKDTVPHTKDHSDNTLIAVSTLLALLLMVYMTLYVRLKRKKRR